MTTGPCFFRRQLKKGCFTLLLNKIHFWFKNRKLSGIFYTRRHTSQVCLLLTIPIATAFIHGFLTLPFISLFYFLPVFASPSVSLYNHLSIFLYYSCLLLIMLGEQCNTIFDLLSKCILLYRKGIYWGPRRKFTDMKVSFGLERSHSWAGWNIHNVLVALKKQFCQFGPLLFIQSL